MRAARKAAVRVMAAGVEKACRRRESVAVRVILLIRRCSKHHTLHSSELAT